MDHILRMHYEMNGRLPCLGVWVACDGRSATIINGRQHQMVGGKKKKTTSEGERGSKREGGEDMISSHMHCHYDTAVRKGRDVTTKRMSHNEGVR